MLQQPSSRPDSSISHNLPDKPTREPKYTIGKIVYFIALADHLDNLVQFYCIGKGKITNIRGRYYSWEPPGVYYQMQGSSYVEIKEAHVFIDTMEAIKVLDEIYATEDGDCPHGWYV